MTRSLQAVVLKTIAAARDFIARTTTTTGLSVFAEITRKTYRKGQATSGEFLANLSIRFDDFLPELNDTAPATY